MVRCSDLTAFATALAVTITCTVPPMACSTIACLTATSLTGSVTSLVMGELAVRAVRSLWACAGLLGELVIQADQASVAQALGGNPNRALSTAKPALQRKLLEGLRAFTR